MWQLLATHTKAVTDSIKALILAIRSVGGACGEGKGAGGKIFLVGCNGREERGGRL